ncbi:MAG: hypothetical protein V3U72_04095 [Candidatus Aenigmarchaeota archaeon]
MIMEAVTSKKTDYIHAVEKIVRDKVTELYNDYVYGEGVPNPIEPEELPDKKLIDIFGMYFTYPENEIVFLTEDIDFALSGALPYGLHGFHIPIKADFAQMTPQKIIDYVSEEIKKFEKQQGSVKNDCLFC